MIINKATEKIISTKNRQAINTLRTIALKFQLLKDKRAYKEQKSEASLQKKGNRTSYINDK